MWWWVKSHDCIVYTANKFIMFRVSIMGLWPHMYLNKSESVLLQIGGIGEQL